jgi:hypothetical protein
VQALALRSGPQDVGEVLRDLPNIKRGHNRSLGKFIARWEYAGAYRRTQLFTSGEGCGLRIFLGALDWLGQGEFKRKVTVLPRRRTTQGQSK